MGGPAYYTGQINIAKNADWIVSFRYTDDTDAPIDLTGSVVKMEIRNLETDHTAVVSVHSPDDGINMPDPTNGQFEIEITRDRLVRLATGDYVADIVRLMSDGIQERIWEGPVIVVEGTTR